MSDEGELLVETSGGVRRLTMNRPGALNAMTVDMIAAMTAQIREADTAPDTGVVVIRGAGGKSFSVGADRSIVNEVQGRGWLDFAGLLKGLFEAIRWCGRPVIAEVDGWCLGGGHELHCFCDLTVASDRSVFGQVGPRVGGAPLFVTQMLSRAVGDKKAKEIMFLCERYTAREALDMGLVNRVTEPAELGPTVAGMAERLLAMSPTAIRLLKRGVAFGQEMMDRDLDVLIEEATTYFGSPEQREAVAAFEEGRDPDYGPFR